MTRVLLTLALLLYAAGSRADDAKPPPKKAPAPAPMITPAMEKIRAVDLAKVRLMAAVGSCPKAEDCDPASERKNPELVKMLMQSDEGFMEACVQCATDAACEKERDRIRAGRGRFGFNVCAPPAAKPATPATADKKAGGEGKAAPKPTSATAPK